MFKIWHSKFKLDNQKFIHNKICDFDNMSLACTKE